MNVVEQANLAELCGSVRRLLGESQAGQKAGVFAVAHECEVARMDQACARSALHRPFIAC